MAGSARRPTGDQAAAVSSSSFVRRCLPVATALVLLLGVALPMAALADMPMDAPGLSPGGANTAPPQLSDSSTITVTGNRPARVSYQVDGQRVDVGVQALPYVLSMPQNLAVGRHELMVQASYPDVPNAIEGFYELHINHGLPPVLQVLQAPKTFYPHRDHFADSLAVVIEPDTPGTAVLTLRRGSTVVAHGSADLQAGVPSAVSAGLGLRGGTYTWSVLFTSRDGRTTNTPVRTVVADPRRAVSRRAVVEGPATHFFLRDASGVCGRATRAGDAVLLVSQPMACTASNTGADLAIAEFSAPVRKAVGYGGTVTVTATTSGSPAVLTVLLGDSSDVAKATSTVTGTASIAASSTLLTSARRLHFAVGMDGGQTAIQDVRVNYSYLTLAR